MGRDDYEQQSVSVTHPIRAAAKAHVDMQPEPLPDRPDEVDANLPVSVGMDAMQVWLRVGQRLAALIGESGFCALFVRAMRLMNARYEWLSVDPSRRSMADLLAALERDLAHTDSAAAAIAQTELLHTFTRQLSTLIGEALTARLLKEVMAPEPNGPEDAQESIK